MGLKEKLRNLKSQTTYEDRVKQTTIQLNKLTDKLNTNPNRVEACKKLT